MALELTKDLSFGVSAKYWRIDKITVDRQGNVDIRLVLYLSEAACISGRSPVLTETHSTKIKDFDPAQPYNLWKLAYNYLRELEVFSGAIER